MHDVAIIGAGPAGSAAAITLASQGVDVALLDRAEFPRDKACGDMLSRAALRALDRLGLSDLVSRHRSQEHWSGQFRAPGGKIIRRPVSTWDEEDRPKWVTIPRLELDAALVERAQAVGANLMQRAPVGDLQVADTGVWIVTTGVDGGRLDARLAIVATGSSDKLALGEPDLFALRGYFEGDGEPDIVLRFDRDLLPGYVWRFPIADGLYNIGLGMPVHKVKEVKADHRLRESDLAAGKKLVGRLKGAFLNTSFSAGKAHGNRTLWVGDAAGLIQPHLAEGLSPALRSGKIAARSAVEFLENGTFAGQDLAPYTHRLHAEFDGEMRLSRMLHWMMKHPLFLNAFGELLASQHSRLFRLFARRPEGPE
jgi:geranylgeranyl reductase family protein